MPLNLNSSAQGQLLQAWVEERKEKLEYLEDIQELEKTVQDLKNERDRLNLDNASLTAQLKKTRLREHKQKMAVASTVARPIADMYGMPGMEGEGHLIEKLVALHQYLEKYTFWVECSEDMEVVTLHDGCNTDADRVIQLPID